MDDFRAATKWRMSTFILRVTIEEREGSLHVLSTRKVEEGEKNTWVAPGFSIGVDNFLTGANQKTMFVAILWPIYLI